ncbi:MAG: ROK family protein [Anaerolineales bacterium]|nr:ROK family protein [Anaerolineales bacterium]
MNIFGAVESGGTKFVCMVATGPDNILAETRFPTTDPDETLRKTVDFFVENRQDYPLKALGIGTFGPMDLDPKSPTFGFITTTPKAGWNQTDITGILAAALKIPVAVDTDVNAAALGEHRWGAAQGLDPMIYITIGTGIGAGGIYHGKPMHGLVHPEVGHIRIPHDRNVDPFEGICPYHKDCLEGLASGKALEKRWGQPAKSLPDGHPAWELEADYLALALVNLICALSPKRIVLGGGVMKQDHLLSMVRRRVQHLLNNYIQSPIILHNIQEYIVPPGLKGRSGGLGAIALAIDLFDQSR